MNVPDFRPLRALVLPGLLALAACSGGGSDDPGDPDDPDAPAGPVYSVGGTLTGLENETVTMWLNYARADGSGAATQELEVTANGAFVFPTALPEGSTYEFSLPSGSQLHDPEQLCDSLNVAGTIATSDVTNIEVSCVAAYRLSGSVSGMEGTPKDFATQLRLGYTGPATDDAFERTALLNDNGPFQFSFKLRDGDAYNVGIDQSPSEPEQTCKVENNAGSIAGADVDNLQVTCGPLEYDFRFTVDGLEGQGAVLAFDVRNPDGSLRPTQPYELNANGTFAALGNAAIAGSTYRVYMASQPANPDQACRVENGEGEAPPDGAFIEVGVTCGDASIGGTVSGLYGSGLEVNLALEVEINGNVQMLVIERMPIDENGEFVFNTLAELNEPYRVSVGAQPEDPDQECFVENAEGIVTGSVTDVLVKCPGPKVFWRFEDSFGPLELGVKESGTLYREYKFPTGPAVQLGTRVGLGNTPLFETIIDRPGGDGALYSSVTGKTFWTLAESPRGRFDDGTYTGLTTLHRSVIKTYWSLRKLSNDAEFKLVVSGAELLGYADDYHQGGMTGRTIANVEAWRIVERQTGPPTVTITDSAPFYSIGGEILLRAIAGPDDLGDPPNWGAEISVPTDVQDVLWDVSDFDADFAANADGTPEYAAYMTLARPIEIDIDLSGIAIGEEVLISAEAEASAYNTYTNEGGIAAYFRDPAEADPGADEQGMYVGAIRDVALLEVGDIDPDGGLPPTPACDSGTTLSVLHFDADAYEVFESSESELLPPIHITRSENVAGLATATLSFVGGTAAQDEDFMPEDRLVRFGDLSNEPRTLSHFVVDDDLEEGDETLTLTLHSPEGCAEIGPRNTATVTIRANDPSPGMLVFTDESYFEDESAGFAAITVERIGGNAGTANVTVSTADGSAVAGVDYAATTAQVLYQDGEDGPRSVNVPLIDNTAIDGDRTVLLEITSTDPVIVGTPSNATLTIFNDDQPDGGTLQFAAASYAVAEDGGSATATVTRASGTAGEVSVTVATSDDAATAPDDYTAINTVLTFADGDDAPQTVEVAIVNDADNEGDHAFNLLLFDPTGGAGLGAPATVPVVIIDDDGNVGPPPAPVLGVAAEPKQLAFDWPGVAGASYYRFLADPTGTTGFEQVGDDLPLGSTAFYLPVSVHLFDWSNARFLLQACNSSGCTDSNVVSAEAAMLAAIGFFKSSNSDGSSALQNGDYFGYALNVAADGRTLAVGAYLEDGNAVLVNGDQDDNSARDAGAVYLFAQDGTGWRQQAYVKAPNTTTGHTFGFALALSADGNTLVVSAPSEGSGATGIGGDWSDNSTAGAGAAYVYTRDGDVWSLEAYVKASNTGAGDAFGTALALSGDGNTLVVGAPDEDSAATGIGGDDTDDSSVDSGAVYLFRRAGGGWAQQAYVKASNAEADDGFGSAVAVSGDGLAFAVTAQREDSGATGIDGDQADNSAAGSGNRLAGTGAVYLFRDASGGAWAQEAYVKPSNTDPDDTFGASLALDADGTRLAVGAIGESSAATGVNSTLEADNSAASAGAAYLFDLSGGGWMQTAYVKASNTRVSNGFGKAVDLSDDGRYLVVGADRETSRGVGVNGDEAQALGVRIGAAYLYAQGSTGDWEQLSYVKPTNSDASPAGFGRDLSFGWALAISGDGSALAVGAYADGSDARGIGGDDTNENAPQSGAVFMY